MGSGMIDPGIWVWGMTTDLSTIHEAQKSIERSEAVDQGFAGRAEIVLHQ